MMDITNMTDAVLDVVLEARAGADFVDCAHLTSAERYQLAAALEWPMDARTRAWCADAPAPRSAPGPDYELAILAEQDRRFDE